MMKLTICIHICLPRRMGYNAILLLIEYCFQPSTKVSVYCLDENVLQSESKKMIHFLNCQYNYFSILAIIIQWVHVLVEKHLMLHLIPVLHHNCSWLTAQETIYWLVSNLTCANFSVVETDKRKDAFLSCQLIRYSSAQFITILKHFCTQA